MNFDWISILIKLAIVAAVIGVCYWIVSAINSELSDHYVAPVKAEYEAKLASVNGLKDNAEAANRSLREQLTTTKNDVLQCNASVNKLLGASALAISASNKALDEANRKDAASDAKVKAAEAKAASANTQGDFCAKARVGYDFLNDLSHDLRVRDR